jgi:hypothetical protein
MVNPLIKMTLLVIDMVDKDPMLRSAVDSAICTYTGELLTLLPSHLVLRRYGNASNLLSVVTSVICHKPGPLREGAQNSSLQGMKTSSI